MLNREGMRAARDARPDRTGLTADPLLRHAYGGQLEAAAEEFLLSAFERNGSSVIGGSEVPPVLVAAAMHVLNRSAWTQPSDEQVKAAMYLSQHETPSAPPAYDEDDFRRAA